MSTFKYSSDDEIYAQLGKMFDNARRAKNLQDADVFREGGVSSDALNKFRGNKGGITLLNFIRLMRGIGELDRLSLLFEGMEETEVRRVHKDKQGNIKVPWGDQNE